MKKSVRIALIVAGSLSLFLGTLGIVLPVLPTTPFYLLTAWCFMRSSEKLYTKAMNNKLFGNIVRNYCERKAISRKVKIVSVSTTVLTISISITIVDMLWLRILLACIAIMVSIHILRFKTY